MGHKVFWLSLSVWVLVGAYLLFFYNQKRNARQVERRSKFIIIALSVLGTLGGPLLIPASRLTWLEPFNEVRWLAIPLILGGVVLRTLAIVQLGRAFSANVGVEAGQVLVTHGLYRCVRHPSYLGELMGFLGVAVAFHHPLSSTLAFGLPLLGFLYRIALEERVLREHFGQEYARYAATTKRLIPYLL